MAQNAATHELAGGPASAQCRALAGDHAMGSQSVRRAGSAPAGPRRRLPNPRRPTTLTPARSAPRSAAYWSPGRLLPKPRPSAPSGAGPKPPALGAAPRRPVGVGVSRAVALAAPRSGSGLWEAHEWRRTQPLTNSREAQRRPSAGPWLATTLWVVNLSGAPDRHLPVLADGCRTHAVRPRLPRPGQPRVQRPTGCQGDICRILPGGSAAARTDRGTADRGPPTGDRRPAARTDHGTRTGDRRPTTDRRPRTADHGPPTTDRRPRTADRGPPTTERGPPTTDHAPPTAEG
jgi:hypothetical protein